MADTSPVSFRRTRIKPDALPDGAVLIDQLRERTSWAEGMFVTAQHFNRDQSYLITRQGDLGQAIGKGVVDGLGVREAPEDATAVIVSPGIGIGGGGESIVLHSEVRIALGDVSLQRSLTREAGLTQSLQLIAESRSGLFVLCATPVEYTSNPVGSFATSASGQRRLEDSVVNEATLFTLVPFSLNATGDTAETRRAQAARRIFLDRKLADIPPASLPLAMLELDGNALVWLDEQLVRRDAGAARADAFGIGFVDTPARIAHFRQYDSMISEMVTAAPGIAFAAHDRFDVLPPMGRMPAACVAPRRPAPGLEPVLSHNFFSGETPVELVALPEDEIDQLLEESLTMPPIDLAAKPEALAQTPVSIIVPVPRAEWATAPTEIVQNALTLQAAAPLGAEPKTPMELIDTLLAQDEDADLIDPTVSAEWLALLAGRSFLWYARRRQFLRTDALAGEAYQYQVDPPAVEPPVEPPVEPSGPTATSVISDWGVNLRRSISPLGHDQLFDRLFSGPTTFVGQAILPDIYAALTAAIGAGSAVAITEILHRATPEQEPSVLDKIRTVLIEAEAHRNFAPFEGLLTGGLLDIIIPTFPGEVSPPTVRASVAKRANLNVAPVAAENLPVPADMSARVKELLESLTIVGPEAEAILAHGGGPLPQAKPRDLTALRSIFDKATGLEVPLIVRQREIGSVEAQTRRNLLAMTSAVPSLIQKFAKTKLAVMLTAIFAHLEVMDGVLGGTAPQATAQVEESVQKILEA